MADFVTDTEVTKREADAVRQLFWLDFPGYADEVARARAMGELPQEE